MRSTFHLFILVGLPPPSSTLFPYTTLFRSGADRRGDVVVARGDVGRERPEGVEGRLVADLELALHVLLDEMHGDVARALDHDLRVRVPGDRRQLAERFELGKLGLVVRVGGRTGTKTVAQREGDVVGGHDLADLAEVGVEEALLMAREAPLRHDRAAA